ncbi:MAG TPA: CYTH domain-containing protein [Planctomycetes bacterium]|nr:CYTH domain-containing protein [Planctomycetota bacterium]
MEFDVPIGEAMDVASCRRPLEDLGTPVMEKVAELLGRDARVECWGTLENRRRRYRVDSGLLLEIDETRFPDGSKRFEVEVESSDPEGLRQQVESLLADAGVHWTLQEKTKSEELKDVLRLLDE